MRNLNSEERKKQYEEYVSRVTPRHSLPANMAKAFLTGGLICTAGQAILNLGTEHLGMGEKEAGTWCSLLLVLASALLTALHLYARLAKFGGAGALVPITGFANSVASPAIEYQKEGQVFGIGCKIFTIAGPVILYGIGSSALLGLVYYVYQLF